MYSASWLRRTRRVRLHAGSGPLANKPTGMTFEEAAAVCDGACLALAGLRRAGSTEGRSRRLRRIRIHRHRGGAAREVLRRRRHRGVQYQECRAREVAGSRKGDRPHAGRLHAEWRGLRLRLRLGWQALVPALQTAEARWDVRRVRPRVPVACPGAGPADQVDRRQEGDARDISIHERGRPLPQGADRVGEYRAVVDRPYQLEQVVEATRYVETQQKTGTSSSPCRRRLSASRALRVNAAEVDRDGEEQRAGPPVDGIERQGLLVPDEVPDQPDDEPEQRHGAI